MIANPAFQAPDRDRVQPAEETANRRKGPADVVAERPLRSQERPIPASATDLAAPLAMPADKRLSLAITAGPDAARVFRVEAPRTVIGRSDAGIVLDDVEASRSHAALEVRGNRFFLYDLKSRNGTFINSEQIGPEPVEIDNHSEFRVGTTTLMLIVTENE